LRRLALGAVLAVVAAVPAGAAPPLLLDTWDYEMQSTRYRGPVGHFEGSWNFERPNLIRLHIPGYAMSKPRPLRPRGGWLVATFRETRKCFRVEGGKQNVYRYRQVVRLRPTKVHDMEGERLASAARFRQFSSTKPCIGRRIAGTFLGRAKRETGPERGSASISYSEADGCDTALVEHSASEGDFLDWDLPVFSYLWTFSDGGSSTVAKPKHRYPGPGTHGATVLMRSVNGSIAKGTETIEVSTPDPDC
jgi:PKD domain